MTRRKILAIAKAQYLKAYRIRLTFSDETVKVIDFKEFLKSAKNPMTRKYLDLKKFKNFRVEYGDLVWGDYELCFPIWDLYSGEISGKRKEAIYKTPKKDLSFVADSKK
jgi:hypothetical protein